MRPLECELTFLFADELGFIASGLPRIVGL